MSKILVAFASKHGSTAEIAESIGEILRETGHSVDVRQVDTIQSIHGYELVILGSAVYSGHWLKEAVNFLRIHQLVDLPLYLFSSGPIGEAESAELQENYPVPDAVKGLIANLKVRDIQVFHGKIDLRKLTLAELMLFKSVGAQTGDFRKWDRIKLWAQHIGETVAQA